METTETTTPLETPSKSIPAQVTVVVPERSKKKKKYTRGLRDIQKFDRGLAKASRRVNRAVADGYATYLKKSDKSARKRRDGAIKDAFQNWAKAMGKTVRRASSAPEILAESMDTKSNRRQVRTLVQLFTFPFAR
jgi:hypothetical protein